MSDIKKGTTGRTEYFRLITNSGTALLGALINSMTMSYVRDRSAPVSSIMTGLSSEGAVHAAFKGFEIYSGFAIGSNWAPGLYRADVPDAAFTTGVDKVIVALTHPLADAAMKELVLVDNVELDTFTVVTSNAIGISSAQIGVNSLYARVGAPVGVSLAADVSSVQTGVNSLLTGAGSLSISVGSVQTGVNSIYARIGSPVGASLVVDVSSVQVGVSSLQPLTTSVSSVQTGVNSLYARVGAPVGASLAVDVSSVQVGVTSLQPLPASVGSVQIGVNSLYARVGAPVGASLAIDVKSIQTQVDSIYGRIGENGINITSASVSVGGATVTDISSAALALFFTRDSGKLYTDAISGSVVKEIGYTAINSSVQVNSVQIGVNSLYARVGAPVGASLAVDVKSIQTQVDSIYGRIGENGINITSASIAAANVTVADVTSAGLARFFNRDSGLYYSNAVSGSVVAEITKNAGGSALTVTDIASGVWGSSSAAVLRSQIDSIQTGVNSLLTSAGSLHTRVSSVQTGVDSIYARVGAPVGASLSVDVSSIQAGVNSLQPLPASVGSVQTGVNSLYARVGASIGASLAIDVASIAVQVGSNATALASLHTRVGSEATQVSSIFFKTDALPSDPADQSLIIAATNTILTSVGSVQTGVDSLQPLSINVSSIQIGVNSLYARVGAPVGASLAVDVSSVQAGVNSLQPLSVSVSSLHTRVSSVQTGADTLTLNVGSVQIGVNSLYARVGAPTGASLATDVASVQIGVNSLQPLPVSVGSVQTGVNSLYARVGSSTGADLATDVGSVQTGVRSLAALITAGGRMLSDMTAINSDATAASNVAKTTRAIGRGTVTGGGTVGNVPTATFAPVGVDTGQFLGRIITFDADTLTTALRAQATDILSSSAAAAPTFGVTSLTTAPLSGDTFSVT